MNRRWDNTNLVFLGYMVHGLDDYALTGFDAVGAGAVRVDLTAVVRLIVRDRIREALASIDGLRGNTKITSLSAMKRGGVTIIVTDSGECSVSAPASFPDPADEVRAALVGLLRPPSRRRGVLGSHAS